MLPSLGRKGINTSTVGYKFNTCVTFVSFSKSESNEIGYLLLLQPLVLHDDWQLLIVLPLSLISWHVFSSGVMEQPRFILVGVPSREAKVK